MHHLEQGECWVAAAHRCHVIRRHGAVKLHRRRLHLLDQLEQFLGAFNMAHQYTADEWRQMAQDG